MKFIIITLIVYLFFTVKSLDAFCVYNKVEPGEATFWVRQEPYNAGWNYFSRFFRSALASGESACCPYDVSDCVRPKSRDAIIYLVIRRTGNGRTDADDSVVISMPGGGWVTFSTGMSGRYHFLIDVYNADGTPFAYEHRIDMQAGSY